MPVSVASAVLRAGITDPGYNEKREIFHLDTRGRGVQTHVYEISIHTRYCLTYNCELWRLSERACS